MDFSLVTDNVLSPPILFFALGLVAVLVRADLKIPEPIPKLFSLYLLWAIGFKGGVGLAQAGWSSDVVLQLGAAILLSIVVPVWAYAVLRRRLGRYDAAGIAATYGSISAVTFITAANFLEAQSIEYGGHMVAAMALMEAPAIIIAVAIVRFSERTDGAAGTPGGRKDAPRRHGASELLRECVLNGPVFLLLGSLLIGLISGPERAAPLKDFSEGIFKGVLTLFLLDMGLLAGRRLGDLRQGGLVFATFALLAPLVNAGLAAGLAKLIGMDAGNAMLLIVLAASASYIAVPAALRTAIPQASASIYVPLALAVTFPFNISVGIPLYLALAKWIAAPG